MKPLKETADKLLRNFFALSKDDWVEWIAQENSWQDNCDKFNGCYFIVQQMPKYPQHRNCLCLLEKIEKPKPNVTATADVDIRKFTDYIFNIEHNNGKKELFENWGFSIKDSNYLQQLYASQALQKYCNGNYVFNGTNDFAVKIQITLDIPTPQKGILQIKTGWTLLPSGKIKLSTPFTGFSN